MSDLGLTSFGLSCNWLWWGRVSNPRLPQDKLCVLTIQSPWPSNQRSWPTGCIVIEEEEEILYKSHSREIWNNNLCHIGYGITKGKQLWHLGADSASWKVAFVQFQMQHYHRMEHEQRVLGEDKCPIRPHSNTNNGSTSLGTFPSHSHIRPKEQTAKIICFEENHATLSLIDE